MRELLPTGRARAPKFLPTQRDRRRRARRENRQALRRVRGSVVAQRDLVGVAQPVVVELVTVDRVVEA